jgi:hypothetical protein
VKRRNQKGYKNDTQSSKSKGKGNRQKRTKAQRSEIDTFFKLLLLFLFKCKEIMRSVHEQRRIGFELRCASVAAIGRHPVIA